MPNPKASSLSYLGWEGKELLCVYSRGLRTAFSGPKGTFKRYSQRSQQAIIFLIKRLHWSALVRPRKGHPGRDGRA